MKIEEDRTEVLRRRNRNKSLTPKTCRRRNKDSLPKEANINSEDQPEGLTTLPLQDQPNLTHKIFTRILRVDQHFWEKHFLGAFLFFGHIFFNIKIR